MGKTVGFGQSILFPGKFMVLFQFVHHEDPCKVIIVFLRVVIVSDFLIQSGSKVLVAGTCPEDGNGTIVNFNEEESKACIYTFNTDLKRRLAEFS